MVQGVFEPTSIADDLRAQNSGRIGKYQLTEKLGQGGMGEVWKALDTDLNRWVALKFLKGEDPSHLARLQREAHTAAGLTHPNIAGVYEISESEGRHFIAMQFVQGRTLESFSKADRRLLVQLIRDAARALDHAHRQGVIHRDIKPANLMVTQAEEGARVIVLDFGLARPIEGGKTLSQSGGVLGTPAYMSPEQARGEKLDERSDVYSLGATLYEVLTGKTPFEGTGVLDLIKKVEVEEPLAPRKINPSIPRDLETVALKCLEKDRDRRYATAKDFANDLNRWLEGDAVQARPASAMYRFRMRLAKRKAVVATAGVAAMLLTVALGWWLWVGRPDTEHLRHMAEGRKLWEKARMAAISGIDPAQIREHSKVAREQFEEAIRERPESDAHLMRGRCLELEGQDDEAMRALERAYEMDPANAEARVELAKVLFLRYQASRGTPTASIYAAGSSVESRRYFSALPSETVEERGYRERGGKLIAEGRASPAQESLLKGLLAMGMGNYSRAAEALSAYTKTEPWDAQAHEMVGISLYHARDFSGAIKALDRALSLVSNANWFRWRGLAKDALGLYDEAIADHTNAIESDPRLAIAYSNRGIAKGAKGLYDEAIEDHTKAIELDPRLANAYTSRGAAKVGKGLYDEAIADYTKAIELDPKDADAHANRGTVQGRKGHFDKAIADCTKAIELDPRNSFHYANRGTAHFVKGQYDEAIADYAKAIELEPKEARHYVHRGSALFNRGQRDEAIEEFTKAIALDPKLVDAYYNRASAKYTLGLTEEAIADDEMALSVATPGSPHRSAIKRRLKLSEPLRLYQQGMKLFDQRQFREAIEKFKIVAESHPRSEPGFNSAYNIACAYSLLGEKSNALEWLEKAVETGWNKAEHMERDPDLEALRGEERYRKIMESIKRQN